jgi:adenylate cyclase
VLISGSAYEHVRGRVKASFADLGEQDLKNIARPVRAYRLTIDGPAAAGAPPKLPVKADNRDRLSIAVLPFQNMSGDPEQDYFADGISEDIITALSKLSQLFVIARNSSFSFQGKNVQVQEIGKTLGARYVLEGSVRKVDKRVRITAQLIDAANDGHLWAEHSIGI